MTYTGLLLQCVLLGALLILAELNEAQRRKNIAVMSRTIFELEKKNAETAFMLENVLHAMSNLKKKLKEVTPE